MHSCSSLWRGGYIWITCLFGVIDAAKHVATHVRAVVLSQALTGGKEIDRAALLRGALLPGVLQGPLQPVCHCHCSEKKKSSLRMSTGLLDKFLEFKN
jgi:hypothetical protein